MPLTHAFPEDIKPEWQEVHKLFALELDGNSFAVDGIREIQKSSVGDFKKLLRTMELVARKDRVMDKEKVQRGRTPATKDCFEMKGGLARLFYFHLKLPVGTAIVVCTNTYWKTKPSRREQDAAFERCAALRQMYLQGRNIG